MTRTTPSAAQIIEDKGGSASFARAIGSDAGAVRMMKYRNKLPRSVWPEIVEAFPDVTLDVLKGLEARASEEESASGADRRTETHP